MTLPVDPWPFYADLQELCDKLTQITGYTWGIERALCFLVDAIATRTVPSDPDELVTALNRTIASEARLTRSHAAALRKCSPILETASAEHPAAEARLELTRIIRLVSNNDADANVIADAALGYVDHEIAARRNSTPGAVRVRLSRIRLKLAA